MKGTECCRWIHGNTTTNSRANPHVEFPLTQPIDQDFPECSMPSTVLLPSPLHGARIHHGNPGRLLRHEDEGSIL